MKNEIGTRGGFTVYNFDQLVDRKQTRSYKWDQVEPLFGDAEILPLWVADMDYPCLPEIKDALIKRSELGAYGYAIRPQSYLESIVSWYKRRHQWDIDVNAIIDVPSVVTTLSLSIDIFTNEGDKVLIQTPVYYPFYDVINGNNRELIKNELKLVDYKYEMDFTSLEEAFKSGVKMMLLCNPHNPGGRVWEREVLEQLAQLAVKYNVIVVSDEIHCDLVFEGHRYTPFASLSDEIAKLTITAIAPTKTFNIPGLHISSAIITNPELRKQFDKRVKVFSLHMASHFAQDAVEAAYNYGAQWVDELLVYVFANQSYAIDYLAKHAPQIKPMISEGTYLLWLDCRAVSEDPADLKKLMHKEAKVAFNEGSMFGEEGKGWLRVNLACPRYILEEALSRFVKAIQQREVK